MGALETEISTFATDISNILVGLGATVFVIGIAVAAIMRITAFGNETRIARSNQAIICAVVGFAIVLLANVFSGALSGIF